MGAGAEVAPIGADAGGEDELLGAGLAGGLDHGDEPDGIGLEQGPAGPARRGPVSMAPKWKTRLGLIEPTTALISSGVGQVEVVELDLVGQIAQPPQLGGSLGHMDGTLAVVDQHAGDLGPDEPCPAGDECRHLPTLSAVLAMVDRMPKIYDRSQ